ncbi:hypothetical protein [Novosphingobium rosa]|uniref:hypothetical protein n=1 Tax=Novosphingobium rosa TaxID=76978 RepID=UPI00082BC355|nr:hypothetical protein [Novosphingobium rosa]
MRLARRLKAYAAHPDPATAACNRIALLVASSQPTYPLYIAWLAGGTWWVACLTFLSTPAFLAVPALARHKASSGRALLVLAGLGNAALATKALGTASGVEAFLIPTTIIALIAFKGGLRLWLIAANMVIALLHAMYGKPWGAFSPQALAALVRLNGWSAGLLSLIILWMLIPRPSARR